MLDTKAVKRRQMMQEEIRIERKKKDREGCIKAESKSKTGATEAADGLYRKSLQQLMLVKLTS
jgi:hypothetical protein